MECVPIYISVTFEIGSNFIIGLVISNWTNVLYLLFILFLLGIFLIEWEHFTFGIWISDFKNHIFQVLCIKNLDILNIIYVGDLQMMFASLSRI